MKIVHICQFFNDGWTYQENYLTKYHKILGNDVTVLTSTYVYKESNELVCINANTYVNELGVTIVRLKYNSCINNKFKKFIGLKEELEKEKPNILFIHGCQFMDMDVVVKYLKENKNVKVYVDNHADYSNSATNFLSKNILHKIFWKRSAKIIEPYATKFYGVMPARVDFLTALYKLPKEKCELLVMGADDEKVKEAAAPDVRESIRRKYKIGDDDFLLVTGGKIDEFKRQTLYLMDAVNNIDNRKVKLIVFGSVIEELKEEVSKRCSDQVKYIGWIKSDESYKYFSAADLVVFPGRHSVFWEQVAGQGIPMIVKYWEGTTHIDLGGNVKFLYNDSTKEIQDVITEIAEHPDVYKKMKTVATEKGINVFSYMDIAKRSIEYGGN